MRKGTDSISKGTSNNALGRRIRVIDIEGVGPVYSKTLGESGINYIDEMLEAGATRGKRQKMTKKTGISSLLIMDWVNMAARAFFIYICL